MISNVRNAWVKSGLLPAALLLCASASWGASWTISGRVVRIADGDTLTIEDAEGLKTRIRVADIDAPEACEVLPG